MSNKVGTTRARSLDALGHNGIVVLDVPTNGEDVLDILRGLINVALDIHSETRGLWDGETEVEGNHTGNASKPDEETPSMVDGNDTRPWRAEDLILVCRNDDDTDECGD